MKFPIKESGKKPKRCADTRALVCLENLKITESISMAQLNESELMKSVNDLCGLASKIFEFNKRLEELQKHVDFIGEAMDTMDAKFNNGNAESLELTAPSVAPETTPHHNQTPRIVTEEVTASKAPTETAENDSKKSSQRRTELHALCEAMCSRGLRKYVVSNLSEIQSVRRDEAISALKSAPNPAKLVLDCVGRFFLQGIRAYTKNSPMITSRQASVLMLELFLTVIGESEKEIEIEKPVKQEAENNAIAWKKRLISEGGVCKACEIDARGLLLFIACFGIPKGFKNDDIRDLIRFSNVKEIGHLLKGSRVLVQKIPEIVENMKKHGMHVEAVDVVYSFGIEEKFSHKILISFLRESKDAWKRTKRDAPVSLKKEANEKHLAALQSVIKCLEDKKIDPAKLLPGWQIKDKIIKLEKDIADWNKQKMENKIMPKRKAVEIESSNKWNGQGIKHCRFTDKGSTLSASSLMTSSHVFQVHDPRAANYADEKRSYDGLTSNLFDGGFCGYINSHPAVSAASHIYNTGALPDVLGPTVGAGGRVNAVSVEVSMSPGITTRPPGSFNGVHGGTAVDKYGQMMYANGSSYGWHRAGDAAYNDRVIGSFTGQPATIAFDGLYRPSPSLDRFPGLINHSSIAGGNQNSSSDLYSFADSVI